MRRLVTLLATCLAFPLFAADYALPAGANEAATRIDRASIEAPIRYLASDLLEGRGPATRGDELAQLYLATEMQAIGLEPGGENGTWFQPFDIVGINSQVPKNWAFRTAKGQTVSLETW